MLIKRYGTPTVTVTYVTYADKNECFVVRAQQSDDHFGALLLFCVWGSGRWTDIAKYYALPNSAPKPEVLISRAEHQALSD